MSLQVLYQISLRVLSFQPSVFYEYESKIKNSKNYVEKTGINLENVIVHYFSFSAGNFNDSFC